MSDQEVVSICTAYRYKGPDYCFGGALIRANTKIFTAIPSSDFMQYCQPLYKQFPGWLCNITGVKKWYDLPQEVLYLISFVEQSANVKVIMASVGPDRDQTIFAP